MPETVNVPPEFSKLFENAEKNVKQYFSELNFTPKQGTISVHNARYVLIRGAAFSVEFFQLIRKLFGDEQQQQADEFASSLLYELAHTLGRADAKNFHQQMQLQDPLEKLSAGPIHFAHSGWAFVEILPESTPIPDENFCLIYKHPYSFECDAWLESTANVEHPVCVMNAGYSSGWCQESFAIPLEAREITCRSLSHQDCLFIMAQPQVIEQKIADFVAINPQLTVDVHAIKALTHPYADTEKYSQLQTALQHRLLTYARQLETSKQQLSEKVEQLNQEITQRKALAVKLIEREKYWRELIDTSFDAILVCRNEEVIEANKMSQSLFANANIEIAPQKLSDLFPAPSYKQIQQAIIQQQKSLNNVHLFNDIDDKYVDIHLHYSTDNENQSVMILAIRDITERAIATQRLERLANYDVLTGLPNRTRFQQIINRALMEQDFSKKYALLFLDLDGFKQVNDNLGHSAGDYLLFEVAKRMTEATRGVNTISRLGGDEFAIWIPKVMDLSDGENVAQQVLSMLQQPFIINGKEVYTTVSIGIAVFPKDGIDYSTLINHADHAMYQAKSLGKNQYHCYQSDER